MPPSQRSPAPPRAPRSPIARYSSSSTGKRQLRAQELQVAPPPREARAPVRRIAAQHPRHALPAPPRARARPRTTVLRARCGLLRSAPPMLPTPPMHLQLRSTRPFSPGGAGTPQLARRGRGDGPRAARAACRRAPPPDEDRMEAATVRCPARRPTARPPSAAPPHSICAVHRSCSTAVRPRRRTRVVVACPPPVAPRQPGSGPSPGSPLAAQGAAARRQPARRRSGAWAGGRARAPANCLSVV